MFRQFSSYWKRGDSAQDISVNNTDGVRSQSPNSSQLQCEEGPMLPRTVDPVWMVQCDDLKGKWKPFRHAECNLLEEAFLEGDDSLVLVEGGRQQVDVAKREMQCIYWPAPPKMVVRARWFWRHRQPGPYPWAPFGEEDQEELEAFYMRLHLNNYRARREQQPSLKLKTGHTVYASRLTKSQLKDPSAHLFDVVYCKPSLYEQQYLGLEEPFVWELFQAHTQHLRSARLPTQWSVSGGSFSSSRTDARRACKPALGRSSTKEMGAGGAVLGRQRPLRRGYGKYSTENEDELSRPIRHLIFAVHGVGEALWTQEKFATAGIPSLRSSIRPFRKMVLAHADAIATSELQKRCSDGESKEQVKGRIEILPVEWYGAVHSKEMELSQALRRITLPSIPFFRDVANDVALDALLYMSPAFHQRIVDTVADRLNNVYNQFLTHNPDFRGSVSIIGYSLGSVITYDVLANQEPFSQYDPSEPHLSIPRSPVKSTSGILYKSLIFPVQNFFMVGSPVGLFLTIRGEAPSADFAFPTVLGSVCNIFHPNDPVAYRIEPLIQPKLELLDPQYIFHGSGGGKRFNIKLKELAKNMHSSSQNVLKRITSFSEIFKRGEDDEDSSLATSVAESLDISQSSYASSYDSRPSYASSTDASSKNSSSSTLTRKDLESSAFVYNNDKEPAKRLSIETSSQRSLSRTGSFSSVGSHSSIASNFSNYWNDGPKKSQENNRRNSEELELLMNLVSMNSGNRIDYCLQASVVESQNEYLSAFSSHTSYFNNEDLALFVASILSMNDYQEFDVYREMQLAKTHRHPKQREPNGEESSVLVDFLFGQSKK